MTAWDLQSMVYFLSLASGVKTKKLTLPCLCYIWYYAIQHASQYLIPFCDICNFIGLPTHSWSKSNQMRMKFHLWPGKQACIFSYWTAEFWLSYISCVKLISIGTSGSGVCTWVTERVISTDLNVLQNFFSSLPINRTLSSAQNTHVHCKEVLFFSDFQSGIIFQLNCLLVKACSSLGMIVYLIVFWWLGAGSQLQGSCINPEHVFRWVSSRFCFFSLPTTFYLVWKKFLSLSRMYSHLPLSIPMISSGSNTNLT